MNRLDRYLGRAFLYPLLLGELLLLVATWVLPGLRGLSTSQRMGLHHLALPILTLAAAYSMALQLKSRGEWTGLLCQGRSPLHLFRILPVLCLLVWMVGSLVPALGASSGELESRFLHLDAADAFSGSRGLISYETRVQDRLHGVLYFQQGVAPSSHEWVDLELDPAGHLRFRHEGKLLPDLGIRPSRPDRELRRKILGRPPLLSLFSSQGLLYHGLHLLLCMLLPLFTLSLALRFGLPLGMSMGYLLPIALPALTLLLVFLLLALQASALLF